MIHLKPENYVCSTWSGGTTTQVAIGPEGAVYADRNFLWRISSATVDLEESIFTALPDYNRYISTLEGEIDVIHDEAEPFRLSPYNVHAFDGGVNTKSYGRCRDFNLMLRKGQCDGLMESVCVEGSADVSCCEAALAAGEATLLLYICQGTVKVTAGEETLELQAGESALIPDAKLAVCASADVPAVLMKAQIWK